MTRTEITADPRPAAGAPRRAKVRGTVLGVVLVAFVLATGGWIVARSGSADHETTWSSGFACRGDGKMTQVSVDHTGPLAGEPTPEQAVERFASGPGTGLPASGYREVSEPPGELEGIVPASSVDPAQGPSEPQVLRYFVHPSGRGVDVSLRLRSWGEGWTVVMADYCVSAKS